MANEGLQNIQALGQAAASFQGIMQEISNNRINAIQLKAQADFNDSARKFEQRFYSGEINSGNYQQQLDDFMSQQSSYVDSIDYEPAKKFVSEYISGQKRNMNTLVASRLGAQEIKKAEADLQSVYDRLPDGKSKLAFAHDNKAVWSPEAYAINMENAVSQVRVESLADEARMERTDAEAIKWLSDPRNVTDKVIGKWGEVKQNEVANAISMISAQYKNDVAAFVEENIAPKVKSFEERGFNAELYNKSVLAIESSMMDQSDKDRMLSQMTKYRDDSVYDGYRNRIVGTIKETANGGVGYDPELLLEVIRGLQGDNGSWFKTPDGSEEKKKLIEFANGYISGSEKSSKSSRQTALWLYVNDQKGRKTTDSDLLYNSVFNDINSPWYDSVRDTEDPMDVSFLKDLVDFIGYKPIETITAAPVSDSEQANMIRQAALSAMYPKQLWDKIGADGQDRIKRAEPVIKSVVASTLASRTISDPAELNSVISNIASMYKTQIDIFNLKDKTWASETSNPEKMLNKLLEFSKSYDNADRRIQSLTAEGNRILPDVANIFKDPKNPDDTRVNKILSATLDLVATRTGIDPKSIHMITNKQDRGYGDLPVGEPLFVDTLHNKVYRIDVKVDNGMFGEKMSPIIMEADLSTSKASTNLSWKEFAKAKRARTQAEVQEIETLTKSLAKQDVIIQAKNTSTRSEQEKLRAAINEKATLESKIAEIQGRE